MLSTLSPCNTVVSSIQSQKQVSHRPLIIPLIVRLREGRGQLDRRRARGVLNTFARESKARTGRFLREKLISDQVCFLPTSANKERRTGKIRGAFSGMHRALNGWMLARGPPSPAQGLHHHGPRYTMDLDISIFLISIRCVWP